MHAAPFHENVFSPHLHRCGLVAVVAELSDKARGYYALMFTARNPFGHSRIRLMQHLCSIFQHCYPFAGRSLPIQ